MNFMRTAKTLVRLYWCTDGSATSFACFAIITLAVSVVQRESTGVE